MKTFTILAAVAALIAGISVASAQTSSMDKSNSMSSGSAQVTGTGKFCIKGPTDALNCQYASLADCEKVATGSQACSANPNSGTTGSK